MDGVLVDTEPLHIHSFQIYMKELNLPADPQYIQSFIGWSIAHNVQRINEDFLKGEEIPVERGVRRRDEIYIALLKETALEPLPGIMSLIKLCQDRNYKTALASSSSAEQVELILHLLEKNGWPLASVFDSIVNGDQVERRKPAPDIYLRTLKNLNLPASSCWALEDSAAGVNSAKAAGLFAIGLLSPFNTRQQLKKADLVVHSLSKAESFLQTLL